MELPQRVRLLVDTASLVLFQYVCQGLFERHKLLAAVQLCAVVLRQRGELPQAKFEFLLRGPQVCVRACGVCVCALGGGGAVTQHGFPTCPRACPPPNLQVAGQPNPLADWLPASAWGTALALREHLDDFRALPEDLVASARRWREWLELKRPEEEPPPGGWVGGRWAVAGARGRRDEGWEASAACMPPSAGQCAHVQHIHAPPPPPPPSVPPPTHKHRRLEAHAQVLPPPALPCVAPRPPDHRHVSVCGEHAGQGVHGITGL